MIELRHLRYFIAVAEELSFRRAAERIHIDQTPLSRSIRDLEDRLGVSLFLRMPRKLRLTPAGARLLREANYLLIQMERMRRVVRATDARYRIPLRIGIGDGIAQPRLSSWQQRCSVKRSMREFPSACLMTRQSCKSRHGAIR